MIVEHDRVILTDDMEPDGLMAGDVGTVVHVYRDKRAFEVEFVSLDGATVAVVTVAADRVRPARHNEIAHARVLAVA